jgi:predicted nucleic acid-binding protein
MPYNLFVDSDILLDVILNRKPFVDHSLELFIQRADETIQLFTSSSIIINTQYIGEKQIGISLTRTGMKKLLKYLDIINPEKQTIIEAYDSRFIDVEDAIQYFTALQNKSVEYFITRNIKDYLKYSNTPLPVLTPFQFLRSIKSI